MFDADGKPLPYAAERRLLGISREQLARVRWRIGVAVGTRKTDAIVAAARSGLVNVLVTDVITASTVTARFASSPARAKRAAKARRR